MRRQRDYDRYEGDSKKSLLYILLSILGLVLLLAAIFLVSYFGTTGNKNKLRDAINNQDVNKIMAMTVDLQGKAISQQTYEGYKDLIKNAVFNELNGNGGANTSVRVDYTGFLVKKPRIVIEEYILEIKDVNPELIVMVNNKEIKHGLEKELKVVGIPGENVVRLSMNQGFYNDGGRTAVVNFVDGQTSAEVNTGYNFKDYIITVNQPAMLVVNGSAVLELKQGQNTVNFPSTLNLVMSAVDPTKSDIRSDEITLHPNTLEYKFELKKR